MIYEKSELLCELDNFADTRGTFKLDLRKGALINGSSLKDRMSKREGERVVFGSHNPLMMV